MHVLVIIDHPNPGSLTHALAQRFAQGAEASGHSTELCDLHAEGFDPRWSVADIEERATDIQSHQARVEACDALCLVFPLFWYGMPAMTKGWIDRVWTYGWAYDETDLPGRSLLKDRTGVLLVPAAANPETWAPYGIEDLLHRTWTTGMLDYFGMAGARVHVLNGSHGSDARRAGLLDRAYEAGKAL